jgi:hypothetical protein
VSRKIIIHKCRAQAKSEGVKYRLHPLIHTLPTRNFIQDIGKKKTELGTPHLSLKDELIALMGIFYWPSENIFLFSTKSLVRPWNEFARGTKCSATSRGKTSRQNPTMVNT